MHPHICDDRIVTRSDRHAISYFKAHLNFCFHMKDLGLLKYFLVIKVARNESGLYLGQQKYALCIISKTILFGFKPHSYSY